MNGMSSMMGGMMTFGWIGALLVVALIVGGVILLAKNPGGSGSNVALVVLAALGGVALVGIGAIALMHLGGVSCCG